MYVLSIIVLSYKELTGSYTLFIKKWRKNVSKKAKKEIAFCENDIKKVEKRISFLENKKEKMKNRIWFRKNRIKKVKNKIHFCENKKEKVKSLAKALTPLTRFRKTLIRIGRFLIRVCTISTAVSHSRGATWERSHFFKKRHLLEESVGFDTLLYGKVMYINGNTRVKAGLVPD